VSVLGRKKEKTVMTSSPLEEQIPYMPKQIMNFCLYAKKNRIGGRFDFAP
jgi:hypothetical protein